MKNENVERKKNIIGGEEILICNILGVDIAAVNMEWVIKYIKKNIVKLSGNYICISNVHTTITSYEDAEYRAIQNNSIMALADGGPLVTVGRKRGNKKISRVAGPSLMEEIFKISVDNGYRHYFYGSKPEVLESLKVELEKNYPGINNVGMYSPPFRQMTEKEDADIIVKINETESDFVWVGLGAPKQEKWMSNHKGKICGLMIGVGAGFDYFAGNLKRAPEWMQRLNLEWFYRLIQDPKRLFKRYMKTNIKFIWLIFKDMINIYFRKALGINNKIN